MKFIVFFTSFLFILLVWCTSFLFLFSPSLSQCIPSASSSTSEDFFRGLQLLADVVIAIWGYNWAELSWRCCAVRRGAVVSSLIPWVRKYLFKRWYLFLKFICAFSFRVDKINNSSFVVWVVLLYYTLLSSDSILILPSHSHATAELLKEKEFKSS